MAALHDQLVDLPKRLRGQQVHIVYQCLIVVASFVPGVGMTKKLAYSHVLVRQLMQPIKVVAQALLDHSQYQNAPRRHARTSYLSVNAGKDVLVHECKKTVAQSLLRIQILEPNQNRRNIVPGLNVQFDILDANLTAPESRIA